MRTIQSTLGLALLFLAAGAQAAWTAEYEGANTLSLVSRPNGAGSNTRGARIETRDLPQGAFTQTLGPIVTAALKDCSMDDVRRVVLKPIVSPDRIGGTMTRIAGPGIYVNLPSSDRVTIGNWYLAPFLSLDVSLVGEAGPLGDPVEVFEFTQYVIDENGVTQERFREAPVEQVEATVVDFARRSLPAALRKALPRRCK